jgi:hypothetical protein
MHRNIASVPILVLLAGCWVYLSPTTYRCTDVDALRKYWEQPPGGTPGMTKGEVRDTYKQSDSDLALNDKESDVFYFSFWKCPVWRYRFEKNRLVARGYLVEEGGFWNYVETDYKKTRREETPIFDMNKKIIGFKIFRIDPKYDEDGDLIGVERTEEGTRMFSGK